jgi:hypothetical protein
VEALAIEAPKKTNWVALANGALSSDDVRDLWMEAQTAGDVDPKGADPLSKQLMAIAARKDEEAAAERTKAMERRQVPDEDGAVEAEVVEDEPAVPRKQAEWPEVAQVGGGRR